MIGHAAADEGSALWCLSGSQTFTFPHWKSYSTLDELKPTVILSTDESTDYRHNCSFGQEHVVTIWINQIIQLFIGMSSRGGNTLP